MSWIAAALVVGIHVCNWKGSTTWIAQYLQMVVVSSFLDLAVPYFFLASGYFLARHMDEAGWWRSSLRRRMTTLVVPFLIFSTMSLLIEGVEAVYRDPSAVSMEWLLTSYGLNPCAFPSHDVLWFVRAVLFFVVVSPVFKALVDRCPRVTLTLLGLIALVHSPFVFGADAAPWSRFFKYTCAPNGLFFFVLGIAACRIGIPDRLVAWYEGRGAAVALWGSVAAVMGLRAALFICHDAGVSVRWAGVLLTEISIPVTMAALFRIMPSREWPWAWTSFAVFVVHTYILAVAQMAGLPPASLNIGLFVAYVVGISAVTTFAAYWLREYVPKVAAVLLGGRVGSPRPKRDAVP